MYFLLKMVIFHCYVSLPQSISYWKWWIFQCHSLVFRGAEVETSGGKSTSIPGQLEVIGKLDALAKSLRSSEAWKCLFLSGLCELWWAYMRSLIDHFPNPKWRAKGRNKVGVKHLPVCCLLENFRRFNKAQIQTLPQTKEVTFSHLKNWWLERWSGFRLGAGLFSGTNC